MTRTVSLILLLALWVVVACAFPLTMAGCQSSKKKAADQQRRQDEAVARMGYQSSALGLIAGEAKAIKEATDKVNAQLSETTPNPPVLRVHNQAIADSAKRISDGVAGMDKQLAAQKKEYWAVKKDLNECQAAQDAELLRWSMRGIIVGGLIVVLGTAAAIFAKSYPIPLLAAGGNLAVLGWVLGGVSLGLRIFIQSIGPYRWIAGLTVVLCFAAAAVWFTWKSVRGFNTRKAVKQLSAGIMHADSVTAQNVPVAALAAEKMDDTTKQIVRQAAAAAMVSDAADVAAAKVVSDATPVESAVSAASSG